MRGGRAAWTQGPTRSGRKRVSGSSSGEPGSLEEAIQREARLVQQVKEEVGVCVCACVSLQRSIEEAIQREARLAQQFKEEVGVCVLVHKDK